MTLRWTTFAALAALIALAGCRKETQSSAICGNGQIEGTEECDRDSLGGATCTSIGGGFSGGILACDASCRFDTTSCTGAAGCGDGALGTGEECDDGNATPGDGCDASCRIEFCGDGVANNGTNEQCDGSDVAGVGCTDVGNFTGGTLGCDGNCRFDTTNCTAAPGCGDGIVGTGEECDGANLNGASCTTISGLTLTGGTLACANDCTFDIASCTGPAADIAAARNTADGTGLSLSVVGVWVTYVKPTVGDDMAGFFVQRDPTGPALFVQTDTAGVAIGDEVSFTIVELSTLFGLKAATTISGLSVISTGHDVTTLFQNVNAATDLTPADLYESEVVTVDATAVTDFSFAGVGHVTADIATAAMPNDPDLEFRIPDTLADQLDLAIGCRFTATGVPVWRFNARTQFSSYAASDIVVTGGCPAPVLVGVSATQADTVVLTFSRAMKQASITNALTQFLFDNGVTAASATVNGRVITVTLANPGLSSGVTYQVTVDSSVTDTFDTGVGTPNSLTFSINLCGNGTIDTNETCDDSNTEPYDGCSPTCRLETETPHLLITEFVVSPTEGEFIEIYNPTSAPVSLQNIYLADFAAYYDPQNSSVPGTDFLYNFGTGSLAPGAFLTVSLEGGTANFQGVYGILPDWNMDTEDATNSRSVTTGDGLTNDEEVIVLFSWSGNANDPVVDHDIVVYGSLLREINKTGQTIGTTTYHNETTSGTFAADPADGMAMHRCDTTESTETTDTMSNGVNSHNETSENHAMAWREGTPTPGAGPPAGLCAP